MPAGELGGAEAELRLRPLGIRFGLALGLLRRRLEGAEATDFVHNPFGLELALETFAGPINRLPFANNYFWHVSSLAGLRFGEKKWC